LSKEKPNFRYEELTWPEINQRAIEDRVVILPVAMLEDHGHHLPIATDVLITNEICQRTAEALPDDVILIPPQIHGYSPHHMDFPGSITIQGPTLVEYMLDITRSLNHHGFHRILLVNGHGSNAPWLEIVARLTIIEHPECLCALINWWDIRELQETVKTLRTSPVGGMSHAGELETSLMLAIRPQMVDMDQVVKDISYQTSANFPPRDLIQSGGPRLMEYWSTISRTGVMGDPTVASVVKGKKWLAAAIKGLRNIITEFRAREIRDRKDHHVVKSEQPTPP
jgi:creatinine amidohydrolase